MLIYLIRPELRAGLFLRDKLGKKAKLNVDQYVEDMLVQRCWLGKRRNDMKSSAVNDKIVGRLATVRNSLMPYVL
jgi:hypothetical protein